MGSVRDTNILVGCNEYTRRTLSHLIVSYYHLRGLIAHNNAYAPNTVSNARKTCSTYLFRICQQNYAKNTNNTLHCAETARQPARQPAQKIEMFLCAWFHKEIGWLLQQKYSTTALLLIGIIRSYLYARFLFFSVRLLPVQLIFQPLRLHFAIRFSLFGHTNTLERYLDEFVFLSTYTKRSASSILPPSTFQFINK